MPQSFRVVLVTVAAVASMVPGAAAQELPLRRVLVAEVHDDPQSRGIPIAYLVLPALDSAIRPPLVVFTGGPGFAGTENRGRFQRDSLLRRYRDVVVFDQRGTGSSNRISCEIAGPLPAVRDTLFPPAYIRRCRDSVSQRADIAAYTTAASAHDIDAIRRDLGAETVDLFGVSYGTRLAQQYVATYPSRVNRVVLDGVVPLATLISLEAPRHIETAIRGAIARCENAADCALKHPRLAQRWQTLVNELVADEGRRWRFAYAIRGALYGNAALVPDLIAEATSGRSGMADSIYALRAGFVQSRVSTGLHLSANCSEDIAHVDPADAAKSGRGTLMGDLYFTQYRIGCDAWSVPATPRAQSLPRQEGIAALLLSGELDPVTPPEFGERVLSSFPMGRHVVFAGSGHGVPSPCKSRIVAAFLDGSSPAALATDCAR